MKKVLTLLLVLTMLLSVIGCFRIAPITASAAMASKTLLGGYENICLTYTFRTSRTDYGRHTVEDLLPYVAYLDKQGKMQDYFFDSYLFLPCVDYAPSGGNVHYIPGNPLIAQDWVDYVDDTFYKDTNVDALNEAFGMAKETLGGDANKKAGVFFSILYPAQESTSFGTLGGRSLNFSKLDDRKYAVKWIIDEQIKRYNAAGYDNLDLVGFYWLEEYVNASYYTSVSRSADYQLFRYASDYLHSLGLKFIWIPYHNAKGYSEWKSLGFDFASYQPNYFWSAPDANRIVTTCNNATRYGMGMEMEVDGNVAQVEYYKRYMKYLETGMNYGAMNSIKTYYQDGKTAAFYSACYSQNPLYRNVYDLTYKYAKGTLTQSDINYNVSLEDTLPYCANWVSLDTNYTGCKSFVDGSALDYQDVSGKELTDGVIGTSELGTEWHAFHWLTLDEENRMSVTIDLGKQYSDLTHFVAHFSNYKMSGVGQPKDIKFYVSEDGNSFTLLNTSTLIENGNESYAYYISDVPITGRYVKLSFLNSPGFPFVFCSEFLVGEGEVSDIPGGTDGSPDSDNENDSSTENNGNIGTGDNNDSDTNNPEGGADNEGNTENNGDSENSGNTENNGNSDNNEENGEGNNDGENNDDSQTPPNAQYLIGDVNGNGKIDARDYFLLKRAFFDTYELSEDEAKRGDVDGNGAIKARDYFLLKRLFFGTYTIAQRF